MGRYTEFSELEAKFAALAAAANAPSLSSGTMRARKQFVSLSKAILPVRVKVSALALAASKLILREEIYSRYIPSREEYNRLSKSGGKEGGKQAKQRAKLQRGHERSALRQMQPMATNRAWERTGELERHEIVLHGEDMLGQFIVLRNDAANKRASRYATPRKDLGTQGHRKNSVWTKSLNWQAQALMAVRKPWLEMLRVALNRALNQ